MPTRETITRPNGRGPRLSAAERREQLLDAAKAIVGRDGFHAVSIESVAREAGVTRPLVYDHFGSLKGLLEALVEREGERALAALGAVLPRPEPAADQRETLLGALEAYLSAVRADPVTWRLVLVPPEGAPELLRERVAAGRDAVVAELARAVREGVGPASGSPDPELTARTLSAISDESARLVLADPERYPIERVIAHARWWLERFG